MLQDQQLQCLTCLCRSFLLILKKDQNDLILVKNFDTFTVSIQNYSLKDLVQVGEALGNCMSAEIPKEKNNVAAALKNKVSFVIFFFSDLVKFSVCLISLLRNIKKKILISILVWIICDMFYD